MLSFKYVKNIQYFLLISFLFITSKTYLVFPLNTLLEKDYSEIDKNFYYNDTEAFLNYYLSTENILIYILEVLHQKFILFLIMKTMNHILIIQFVPFLLNIIMKLLLPFYQYPNILYLYRIFQICASQKKLFMLLQILT